VEQNQRESDVPVIYLTAFADDATLARVARTGPFAYLLKPYREREIIITIQMALYKTRLERRLRANERRVSAILDVLEECVLTVDAAGRITYLNPAAERVFSRPAAATVVRPAGELLDLREGETQSSLPDILLRALTPGFQTRPAHPLLLVLEHGEKLLVQVETRALAEPGASEAGSVVILRDVTQLHQLEEGIRQAQKLEAVGRLAGGIAHDFNNLLAIINSFADLLLLRTPPGDANEKYFRNIRSAGQRGTELVAQLMTFGRRAPSTPRLVNPADLVGNAQKLLRPLIRENIELAMEGPDAPPLVHLDPGQLEQILVNLCLNARDAIAEEGRITLRLETMACDEAAAAVRNLAEPGTYVVLSVSDTGSGIPEDIRRHIFEPFFTTKEVGKGTGLGLAMVYTLVKQNHGHIEVRSEPGRGSTFSIFLPAATATDSAEPAAPAPVGAPGGNERILLVEDDVNFLECLNGLLVAQGYEICPARDGEEALDCFQRHGGAFDLLLADIVLPKLSGKRLAERLRGKSPGLRVLFMSGYEDSDPTVEVTPGVARLQKPFAMGSLLFVIRHLLDSPAATPA
jgi:hypothetical protein